jgi:L-aspartate oxidase
MGIKDLVPVTPAAHYLCGGILADLYGRTSIRQLFAIGEVACTGLHGANRLASNSLLEAVVMAKFCSQYVMETIERVPDPPVPPRWDDQGTENTEEWVLISQNRNELQSIMIGIVRSQHRLISSSGKKPKPSTRKPKSPRALRVTKSHFVWLSHCKMYTNAKGK